MLRFLLQPFRFPAHSKSFSNMIPWANASTCTNAFSLFWLWQPDLSFQNSWTVWEQGKEHTWSAGHAQDQPGAACGGSWETRTDREQKLLLDRDSHTWLRTHRWKRLPSTVLQDKGSRLWCLFCGVPAWHRGQRLESLSTLKAPKANILVVKGCHGNHWKHVQCTTGAWWSKRRTTLCSWGAGNAYDPILKQDRSKIIMHSHEKAGLLSSIGSNGQRVLRMTDSLFITHLKRGS